MTERFRSETTNAIYRYLLDKILSGELKPGDRMPRSFMSAGLRSEMRCGIWQRQTLSPCIPISILK